MILVGVFVWRQIRQPAINVLLITLDTTRADHLGCYGNQNALTPAIDGLANRGVLWERARTPAPLTLPSHASLFTGLYPAEHGLRSNGVGSLPKSIPTLAEKLSASGYDTAAIVASFVLDQKFGLRRGFAFYDDDQPAGGQNRDALERQRDGRMLVESALDWLNRPRRQPFFCWVHFYDAHSPYLSRSEEFGDQFVTRPYDGEIAHVDRQVQRLLDYLAERRLTESTIVIVVADHGEGLGEHLEREHALTLYDQNLHVPWIWAGPGISTGLRVSQPVSLIDFTPTLLDLLGLNSIPGLTGRSLRLGLSGDEIPPGLCYSATDDPLLEHGCVPLRSLSTERWKYIRTKEPELYELAVDPGELTNLARELPDQLAECESEMVALERRLTVRNADVVALSAAERQTLASLGYVGGGQSTQADPQDAKLVDIKTRLPQFNTILDARELQDRGQSAAAESLAREVLHEAPDYILASLCLADALVKLGQFDDAHVELEKALELHPGNRELHYRVGGILLAQKRTDDALREFELTLGNPPGADELLYVGQLLIQLGQPVQGKHFIERALEVAPQSVEARLSLGNSYLAAKQPAEAEKQFRLALRADPNSPDVQRRLVHLLGGQQRYADALPHAVAAIRLSPANAELRVLHGTLLMALNKLPEAAREFEAAVRLDSGQARAKQFLKQIRGSLPTK